MNNVVNKINITKVTLAIIFVVSFGVIIFFIARAFSKSCASGFQFDSNINSCRLSCPEQIYDYDKQQCHPDCGSCHWDGNECLSCPQGTTWDPKANGGQGDCVNRCISDSDCSSGSCIQGLCCSNPWNGQCCDTPWIPSPTDPAVKVCCSKEQSCTIDGKPK